MREHSQYEISFKVQNKCSHKRSILIFFWILSIPGQVIFSQDHKTKNNYTGAWETPASWDPVWPVPQSNVINLDITINGYITANSSLSFSGDSSKLIVDDTLVINGNLTIADDNDVQVNNNGILIVQGDLIISDLSKIEAKNYIIVTGNITKLGSTNNGEFSSDDNPVKVFIGGTITPSSLSITKPNFPVFNCSSPPTNPYTHSGCSYGDMTDIISDPIYPFFQSTCTPATLTSSDADNSFCAGTSVTFTAGGGTNYNFRVNAISVQNGASATYTTTTLANGAILDVIVTGTCTGTSSGITNTVFALPVPTLTGPAAVCVGAAGNVYTTGAGMNNYLWTVSAGGTITAGGGASNNTVSVTWTTTGAKTVTVNSTNANGCTAPSPTSYNVTVNPLPLATASDNGPVCIGSALSLTGGPATMTTYSWTGPNGFASSLQNPSVSDNATLAMEGVYNLVVTIAGGCTSTATTTVNVNENPIANGGPDQELTFVFETQMAAELSPPETGEWALVSGSGHIITIHSPTTMLTELSTGENIFLWKVQNGVCKASAEVKITVYDLFIPSVITPDGDGKNDYFKISKNIGKVELIIFNRWGKEEYRNSNYLNDWDGHNKSGTELPYDTYFYILKLEEGIIRKGSVLILR